MIKDFQQDHWDHVYTTKSEKDVSWFQEYPTTSIELIQKLNLPITANILDVGGGDSHLAEALLTLGYKNIWVLDISAKAIERAKKRLADKATAIHWLVGDVRAFVPPVQFACWHDRAAFHFLTEANDIERYANIAFSAVQHNGYMVVGTFSENGPQKCSGLDIRQYNEKSMPAVFDNFFHTINCLLNSHATPFQTTQEFVFCSFQRK